MISSAIVYIVVLSCLAFSLYLLESKGSLKFFRYIPAVVVVYAVSMFLASMEIFEANEAIESLYKSVKTFLLPAMLFLMLVQIDITHFLKLGKKLLLAYSLALISLSVAFIAVSVCFSFDTAMASAFGALAGSWMGGTANMIAVGSALEVSKEAFGYALVVDSVNYTLWVMLLLFIVPFAPLFNRFTQSETLQEPQSEMQKKLKFRYLHGVLFISLAVLVSSLCQFLAHSFVFISTTTSLVLFASGFGVLASFTPLKEWSASSEIASLMLYVLVALIGSQAVFESFSDVGVYIFAGFCILVFHACIMLLGAKLLKLDLFCVSVASLANIGGVASAPILAAAYSKSLVSVGVLMAIMGYLIGTFGGLLVGNTLIYFAS